MKILQPKILRRFSLIFTIIILTGCSQAILVNVAKNNTLNPEFVFKHTPAFCWDAEVEIGNVSLRVYEIIDEKQIDVWQIERVYSDVPDTRLYKTIKYGTELPGCKTIIEPKTLKWNALYHIEILASFKKGEYLGHSGGYGQFQLVQTE